MNLVRLILVPEGELSDRQKYGIVELDRQCFSDVDPEEGEECFYSENFARILAHDNE